MSSVRLRRHDPEDAAQLAKRPFPLSKVYGLLKPGPVVLVTATRGDKSNIMTMSWHTMIEFERH